VAFEGVICPWRIASRTSPDDVDDLLQFGRRKPSDDLVYKGQIERKRPKINGKITPGAGRTGH
jgi:hypothetical protein